jgi:hypothetical protein
MKLVRLTRAILTLLILGAASPSIHSQATEASAGRKPWAEVAAPTWVSIGAKADAPGRIAVIFNLVTGTDGADKATVEMLDAKGNVLESRLIGKSKNDARMIEFAPAASGTYLFRITALRNDGGDPKTSETRAYAFSLPLTAPVFKALNQGGGSISIRWNPVAEAERYELSYQDLGTGQQQTVTAAARTDVRIDGLAVGRKYGFTVAAVRGRDRVVSAVFSKTVRAEAEREWTFTWFGQSSKAELNTIRIIDADDVKFQLASCSTLPDGQIDQKGGKFTAFHDGISYYYTVIDPRKENFELSATFAIDYINPVADGQEGFGLLAMDSLGEHGVSARNHYTNSAGIIATKFEATINGVKKTSKDTLGARFVSGITSQVIAQGDTGIAEHATCTANAYSYESVDLVKAGDVYRLTLKKTNTGYHAILRSDDVSDAIITEYIMYGPQKLLQLDKDHVYVGFAVARGCNATISDISMVITDPATDPPAQAEPPELVPLQVKVDSPATYVTSTYPLVFQANADGRITIVDRDRRIVARDEPIRANKDYLKRIELMRGVNDFTITFTPDPKYRPGERQVMASYDRELQKYVESTSPVSLTHSVIYHSYDAPQLHVTPGGSFLGNGTKDDPLDLDTALWFAKPGQPIILGGGTYHPTRAVIIPRGNNGAADQRRVLQSAPGERAIFDFSSAAGGFQLWGDYWTIDGIDVHDTIGNVKGIQVGGNNNILMNVTTHHCGDTGLQISGTSTEPFEKWPRNNLVLNCTSHDNFDPAANNADGFAAKLTCGEGNVFRSCIAYSNIDDGWDLYSKIDTGPIGAVVIESCVAYKNGSLSDGSGNGDGNGFKLGGDGIAVAHRLVNSIAFSNGTSGITSNSDPAIIVENCTSFGNRQSNINLYGKSDGTRRFQAKNNISMKGAAGDVYKEMPDLVSPDNYFWNGAQSVNSLGQQLATDIFVNVDPAVVPGRRPDGAIDMKGFLVLTDQAPKGIGAMMK